ncbi:MAG: hypothetical protein ACRC6H_10825, partial [Culicoidibacterales bacterium]
KQAFKLLKDYDAQKKAGIIEPIFTIATMPELENVTEWDSWDEEDEDSDTDLQPVYQTGNLATN